MAPYYFRVFMLFSFIPICTSQLIAYVIKEECSNGFFLEVYLTNDQRITEISFSDGSRISYEYQKEKLSRIIRYDSHDNELYVQTYKWDAEQLVSQKGWFKTKYVYDLDSRVIAKFSPWYDETIEYDAFGRVIRIGEKKYSYDELEQITEENNLFHAVYDDSHNLIEFNGKTISIDEQNRLVGCDYDLNGNFLTKGIVYGENNLISEAFEEPYFYDSYGRLVQKGDTCYLYLGCEEIASFENGLCKTLKIPGIGGPIAIEIDGKPYATVIDATGIIRKLIDPSTNSIYKQNDCDIFGGGLTDSIPYAYRGKRYDPLTGFIYFGRRFYDPSLHRWLSPDPLGPIDHTNLYQYVYNNPLKYCDPTGGSFWGYVLGLGEIVAGGAIMAGGVGLEIATLGGFTLGFTIVEGSGFALMADGLARTTREAQDIEFRKMDRKHEKKSDWKEVTKKPPRFNGKDLGFDPSQCPGEGFEWRGKGSPESGMGNWLNPSTGEKLHPDLWHPDPKGPHWGYKDPNGISYDLFPDGSWQ